LTLGSDVADDVLEAEDLPRDSRESTPGTKRKNMNVNPSTSSLIEREKEMNKLRNYKISLPSLDDFTPENSMTSGYKSEATSGMSPTSVLAGNSGTSPKSLIRRQDDRFKTQTIMSNTYTKCSDLDSDSSSSSPTAQNQNSGQRKTIRQKRAEEAERFRTQTIEPLTIIEKEAANVVDIITESKTSARSRSASAEGILDSQILEDTGLHGLVGSCDSILEQDLLKENINKTIQISGPRIRKPNEESPENNQDQNGSEKGVRGRRRGLYTPKKITQQINTTTPAPQPIKPVIAPKPKNLVKPRTPGSPRGTRSTQLRQITKTRLASPPSPKLAQKSRIRAPLASPAPSTISCASVQSGTSSTSSQNSSRLVRQGTFTKDEPALSNTVLVDIDVDDKKPPRRPPSAASQVPKRSPRDPIVIPQTRTSALRERSRSRQASGSSTTSSNRSIPKPASGLVRSPSSNLGFGSAPKLGKRTPTNIEIQRQVSAPARNHDISDTVSESAATSGKKGGKREVTSKIASLWKKIEDSKKKDKIDIIQKTKSTDKKVWISKGRVIPKSDMAYLKPDEAQKKIINDFQKSKGSPSSTTSTTETQADPSAMKVRSKSKLSIKLSKFKKENTFTYNSSKKQEPSQPGGGQPGPSQIPVTSTSVPSTPIVENFNNRNYHKSFAQKIQNPDSSKEPAKRLSRIGSFFNPNEPEKPKSAIVPPFNYSPPNPNSNPSQNNPPKPTPTLNSSTNSAVRRNDSYLGSMGRPQVSDRKLTKKSRENTAAGAVLEKPLVEQGIEDNGAPTSSVLVTLV